MIKGIIFDMGGVLIDLDLKRCLDTFREKAGFARIDEYIDSSHQHGFVGDMEAGLISEEEFYSRCLPYCRPGVDAGTLDECFSALISHIEPYKIGLLKELAAKYPLYLLSNTNPITSRCFYRLFAQNGVELDSIFRELFFSFRIKMLKPEIATYREVARRTGLQLNELLFVDDSLANVEGARAAGMHSLQYVQGTDLRQALAKFVSLSGAGEE